MAPRSPAVQRLLQRAAVALALLAVACSGFSVHQRHASPSHFYHHHQTRHHGHHPHHHKSPESTVSPETPPAVPVEANAAAKDDLLEALEDAELTAAAWGTGGDDLDAGVPLFMMMLLRDTEQGTIFSKYSQPVTLPLTAKDKKLASCVQPSRVSVGRAGAMVVDFPHGCARGTLADGGQEHEGWWLVLALQPGLSQVLEDADDDEAYLVVYPADADARDDFKPIAEHRLPNATFVAVDVTKAMNGTAAPRFLVDVRGRRAGRLGAASVLEVAGWERGPLLVHALDWGEQGGHTTGDSMRVWQDVPQDVLHPPRVRSRRRSHRRTTTEQPVYTSAENPLRNAATASFPAPSDGQEDEERDRPDTECCRLERWTVSIAELGWSFIKQPRMLDINFCVGRCPLLPIMDPRFNATTNAIARTAFKAERGESAGVNIPDAQCVPIRFKPVALLMEKDGRLDLFNSNDLSADRCGCR